MLLLVKYSIHEIRPQNEIHENLETYMSSNPSLIFSISLIDFSMHVIATYLFLRVKPSVCSPVMWRANLKIRRMRMIRKICAIRIISS